MSADGIRMTSPGLTEQQRRAITIRGASVALSAGAGCGKTFVLTERFLAEIEPSAAGDRARLSQVAAITFTERAAREMRDRIRAACRRRLMECPDHQAEYWLSLVRDLDAARISTIHSFCASLLRGHAVEAGLDPRFRVLDGAQSGALLFALTDEFLRERLADRDEATLALAARFGLDRLRTMLDRLLAVRQEIDRELWKSESPEGLAARWRSFWESDTVPRIMRRIVESAAAKTVLDVAMRSPPSPPKMRERCDILLDAVPKLLESRRPADDLAAVREAAKVQGGATIKSWGNEAAFERFRDAAKELRDAIDGVIPHISFDAKAAVPNAKTALDLLGLAAELASEYDREKRELAVLDFNDLLILGRNLLTGPNGAALRKRLASQLRLLLVDEFQDTDPLQVEMIKSLCDNEHLRGKLFFVGDHKQSIYRFRGAKPHVFRLLREEIPAEGRLPLSKNFRSQPAVLDFVNAAFADELGPDYEPLVAHRPQISPTPAVEFLWAADVPSPLSAPASPFNEDMSRRERLRRREADWIARRVRSILDSGESMVWDREAEKSGRPAARAVRPGDVAILFRAMTDVEHYEEALRRYGIDYYLVGGRAFYSQQEIYDVLNLLRAINTPCDAVSLVGALRSSFFGLLDESLLWLSQHAEGIAGGLFDRELHKQLNPEQCQRAKYAADVLEHLRAVKDRLPVARLIGEALELTGYDAALVAEFLGVRKLANLQKLIEQARSFDDAGIFALSDFIAQLSEFVVRQPDEALAATHPESTDVVKLMSVHQSKGLEFPVVIVPDVGRPRRSMGPAVAFTPELGPMLKDADTTTGYDLFMMAESEEDLAETKRLLYVATTRAADYLILSSGVEKLGEPVGPWMELLDRHFNLISGELSGAVAGEKSQITSSSVPHPSLPAPFIKVTLSEPPVASKPVDMRRRRDLMKIIEKAKQMAADGEGRQPRYVDAVPFDAGAERQFSFSRLSGKLHVRQSSTDSAGADAEPRIDALGLGTLVHAVLAEIDFANPQDAVRLVRRHADEHLPGRTENELSKATDMVERFLASPRGKEIAAAVELHRELEFILPWPPKNNQADGRYLAAVQKQLRVLQVATALTPCPSPKGRGELLLDGRYLEGFIDCLYRGADGQWRLIDYKTNRVSGDSVSATAAEYEMQMLVYALAVEQILGSPPAELALCFLHPGVEHRFAWGEAARDRVIELVSRALLV